MRHPVELCRDGISRTGHAVRALEVIGRDSSIHKGLRRGGSPTCGVSGQIGEIDPNHEDAYFAAERCYRKLRTWPELINAYERHIAATLDRKTKVDNWLAYFRAKHAI